VGVGDSRTLLLDGGREVRLAGIERPPAPQAAAQAEAELRRLALGRTLRLAAAEPGVDRYGRLLAFAYLDAADGEAERVPSLQRQLVAAGLALAAPAPAGDCAAALHQAEAQARQQELGFWADPSQNLRRAAEPAALLADLGRFAVVEGKILSVRESGGMIYLNFGRRWTEDFTVGVVKRNERALTAALGALKRLEGRRVRVRGWLDRRGGPWMEAFHPGQIEVVAER
jgi:hypothetical protein